MAKADEKAETKAAEKAAPEPANENSKELMDVKLSKNWKGSRKVKVFGNTFDLNETNEKSENYNFAQMSLTEKQAAELRKRGFAVKKSPAKPALSQKDRKRELKANRAANAAKIAEG